MKKENHFSKWTRFLSTRCFQNWLECGRPAAGAPIIRELWTFHRTSLCFTSADICLFSTSELIDLLNMNLKSANLEGLLKSADLEGSTCSTTTYWCEYTDCCNWFYIQSESMYWRHRTWRMKNLAITVSVQPGMTENTFWELVCKPLVWFISQKELNRSMHDLNGNSMTKKHKKEKEGSGFLQLRICANILSAVTGSCLLASPPIP